MMEKIVFLLILGKLVFCHDMETTESSVHPQTTTRNPYANVLSQLSDVIFDVEDRLYRLTAPVQDQSEETRSNEEGRKLRKNYFDSIQENYRNLQDQIGQSLRSPGGILKMSDIINLNFQDKETKSALDLSLPFLPLNIKVSAKKPTKSNAGVKTDKVLTDLQPPFTDLSGSINLGGTDVFSTNTPGQPFENERGVKPELQKRSSKPDERKTSSHNKNYRGKDSQAAKGSQIVIKDLPQDYLKNVPVQGRIMGDLLFSESTFDKYFKRFLKDHGKWLLDSNMLPPKKLIENIREITRDQFTSNKPEETSKVSEPSHGETNKMPFSSKRRPMHHGRPTHTSDQIYRSEPKIILTFTPEGLPLKLKLDTFISKPLKYLHTILINERLSLNVPVSSINGIFPVGNDVLHLGYEESGMPSRTPVLDLSDENQLVYLLRTLNRLKYQHH